MKRTRIAMMALLVVTACGADPATPHCTGPVTADLGMDAPDDCSGTWVHGEQLCPQRVSLCPGEPSICMAFGDWVSESCACPLPEATAALSIIDPLDGAHFTAAEDVDAARGGLQIAVTVDAGCMEGYSGAWSMEVARDGFDPLVPEGTGVPDDSGIATAIVDLGAGAGCWTVEASGIAGQETSGYSHLYIEPSTVEVCVD